VTDDFDALFLAHYDTVYRLAYRIAGTREEAEDLSQEAFLRLHRAPQIWDARQGASGQQNVAGWLYRVVTNLAYNALRGQGRRQRRETAVSRPAVSGPDAASAAADDDPAGQALRDDERETVRLALLRLPERQAQLLLLRYAGLSYREVAAALDIAPGSVGTLLARAEAAFERVYRETSKE
jgi:RNA polymerase sigma-70 factor, ECF subfamily